MNNKFTRGDLVKLVCYIKHTKDYGIVMRLEGRTRKVSGYKHPVQLVRVHWSSGRVKWDLDRDLGLVRGI
jgi:hypothetical protein